MKKRYLLLLFTVLIFSTELLFSQGGVSTRGKEFWFGFMSNYGNSADYLNVYVTSKVSTSGVVSVPGIGFSQNFTVAANSTSTITVPLGCMATGSNTVQPFGIHVVSTDTISVFALNYQPMVAAVSARTTDTPP